MAFVSPVPNAFETCSDAAKSTSVQSTVHSGRPLCTHFDDEDQTRVTLCFLYKCTVYGAQWQTSKGGTVHIGMIKTRQE